MTIRPVGTGLFHAGEGGEGTEGRTDMTKLIVALCKFANAPKTLSWIAECTCFIMSVSACTLFGKCEDHEILKYEAVQIIKVIKIIFRKLLPPFSKYKSGDFPVTWVLTIVGSRERLLP
jgi:hypothetical protein